MERITRREFLRCMAAGLGALTAGELLAACGRGATITPTHLPPPVLVPPAETEIAASSPEPSSTTPPEYPDLVVARGGEPRELVRQALERLGGIGRFVHNGDDVIVKPNICVAYNTYEYAATTNPWVVAALVELCWEAGAGRVRVMDNPFGGTAEEAYARSGIQDQVVAAGGEMEVMAGYKFVMTDVPQGLDLGQCAVYGDVLSADVVIDVPIAKHHSLARLTLGMKNLMGVIARREVIHANLGQRIADLTSLIHPALTVVDAVRILMAGGPTGGNLADVRQLDTVIASADIVAADSYATTLFGLLPDDLDYIRAGAAMGLGRSDLANLKIEEIALGA